MLSISDRNITQRLYKLLRLLLAESPYRWMLIAYVGKPTVQVRCFFYII